MKLREFSELVDGEVIGDPDIEITGASGVQNAENGDITFVTSAKFVKYLQNSPASCVIVKEPLEGLAITQLQVENPYYAFAKALELFYPPAAPEPGISERAVVSANAAIGKDVTIFPTAYIADNASIGDGTVIHPGVFIGRNTALGRSCVIHPNVTIRENVNIGNRVVVHSGTVIGSDGFGYVFERGIHYKIPQVGGVVVGNDVEIGSNVSIDRATTGNTVIGNGTKIDNLVQIAHNVSIGENSLIIAQVGISGSCEIGDFTTLAGQAGIADHSSLEAGTIIGAQAGLTGHYRKGIYSGTPAIPHRNWLKSQALFAKLPEMNRRIKELESKIDKLEKGDPKHVDDK
ncbi:MAG: UDP-3-O-(3-hydroxymyristoyl)glucosamine N-acyltransferase [Candidatus Sulfobium sp.]|jgi:UDP-3-O-[3-hydroxymyristoyl] glucosamine N-acyltransferase